MGHGTSATNPYPRSAVQARVTTNPRIRSAGDQTRCKREGRLIGSEEIVHDDVVDDPSFPCRGVYFDLHLVDARGQRNG
jgi:hypothetical protein